MSFPSNSIWKLCMGFSPILQRRGNRSIHSSRNVQQFYQSRPKYKISSKFYQPPNQDLNLFLRCISSVKRAKNPISEFADSSKLQSSSTIILQYIKQSLKRVCHLMKSQSGNIMRTCTRQCEYVIAHKIRRAQQILTLYTKIWDEFALKQFVKTFQQELYKRGHTFILSAASISAFDWDKERISDEDIFGHLDEMDYIFSLVENTMTCDLCSQRQIVNAATCNVDYCKCKNSTPSWKKSHDDWLPFLEGEDFLIWKKIHRDQSGMFSYKVYGNYNDVTAEDFLQVQLDVNNRKEWDPTVVSLNVIDADPDSNSDVVYWEMEWPRLFANRDYVFTRRFIVDREKKIMLIVSQGTIHPDCPERPETFRVKDYWSFMVIRPYTDFTEPGIEFGLTYFDNPGIAIPSAVTAWVAMSGLPNFLLKLRAAAREVRLQRVVDLDKSPEEIVTEVTPEPPEPQPQTSPANISGNTYFQQLRSKKLLI